MNKLLLCASLLCLSIMAKEPMLSSQNNNTQTQSITAKVKKVFMYEEDGHSTVSYLIKYKGQDVIVSDVSNGDKSTYNKKNDTIQVMMIKDMKTIQFVLMSFSKHAPPTLPPN